MGFSLARKKQITTQLDKKSQSVLSYLMHLWDCSQAQAIRDLLKEKGTLLKREGIKLDGF